MGAKNTTTLTTENNNNVLNATLPESITPAILGALLQDIIDSMYNNVSNTVILGQINMTKAQLSAAISGGTLVDKQWIKITDRADTFPLYVCSQGTTKISPFGIWEKSGKPLAVIMDYPNGYEGETHPFIAFYDENRKLNLTQQIIIADGSQGAGKVLVSDANGGSTWLAPATYQSAKLNPAAMTGTDALMMGLNGSITASKSGKVLITICGEYSSAETTLVTQLTMMIGTGSAPSNGDLVPVGGAAKAQLSPIAPSTTGRTPFSMQYLTNMTIATPYWIDMWLHNNANTAVQVYDVFVTAIEL